MRNRFLLLFFFSCNCFALLANHSVIPPVTIKAKNTENFSMTHAPKTVITQQDIAVNGITTLAQALQELGGVQLQDTTGNGSQVMLGMRGFGANASSNTLLLINGIPITNPDLMPPDLNAIPLQEVEYIEVIAGTESVLYGDQAVGGTINIITKHPMKKQIELSCAGGSYNQHNCYALFSDHIKKLNFNMGLLTNHSDNYRNHNDYDQGLVTGKLDYPYQTGDLAFNYQVANERMQYPGALTAAQVAQNRRQASNDTNFFRDWSGIYHIKSLQQLHDSWRAETDFARREMHGDGVLSTPFTQSRTIYFFKPQIKGTIANAKIASGVDVENDNYYLRSAFGVTNDTQQKYGIFAVATIPAMSSLWFSLGARVAQQNSLLTSFVNSYSINRAVATTLGMTYAINEKAQVYLRRAENFRFPKADENASVPPGVNGLKTQRGVSYETGVQWQFRSVLSKIGIYQLNLRDEIQFDPFQTPENPFGVNVNLDPTVRRGGYVTEKYPINDKLTLDGQYNFVSALFQSGMTAGKRIPLVSENIVHAGANYKFAPRWNLYTEAVYTGSQFSDNDNANIAGRIGGYTTFNLNLRYHFKYFSASLRFNNIFNKYDYLYTVYQPSVPGQFFYPAPGRNFMLTIKYLIT